MKKLLSMLLTLSILAPTFGALPTFAANGENETETQYVAAVYKPDGTFYDNYTSVGIAMVYANDFDGTVKLLADSNEDTPVNVIGGCSAILDLNGFKIKRDRENNMSDPLGNVITLGEQAELTINDSSEAKSGTIEGGGSKWGGGIYAPKNNVVTMNAGTITHCTAYYGGGVYVDESSKFIMNGGTIDHCYAKYGGGVYVEDKATFETHGGKITNNFADEDGGGIYVWSAFANLDNCYIGHNHADKGGGIYSDYNSSKMYSYITISGSDIEGNKSQSGYGGIYHNDGRLTLKDGTTVVENYTNGKYGGGVYSEKCSIELAGDVNIYGNTANSYEPCDVSFGKDLDSAFKLLYPLSSASFIGVNSKYHKPKAWYSDMHISYYHQCDINSDLPKVDPLKDALFSNNLSTGFTDTFDAEDEDYSSTVKQRHYLKIVESGDAVNDRIKVTNISYQNMPLSESEFSSSYDPARRTIFLKVPKYVKNYSYLDVWTDNPNVIFNRGARLTTSTGWGDKVYTRYGLVIQNVNDSPSYTVSVEGGKVDGIEPDASGVSSTKKEFFDALKIEPIEPEGKMFSHWEVEGDYTTSYIIGYNQYTKIPLYLQMPNGNVTFKAIFKDKVTEVDVKMFSPEVGKRTPFYTKDLDHPCLKANVVYKLSNGNVLREDTVDVIWKKKQEMFDGTAIHYFDYYANYLANFQIQDTEDGDFCLANYSDLKMNLYWDGNLLNSNAYDKRYEYVYGDGSMWKLKNDNNPIKQHILYVTRYYTSEKAPIRKSVPSQIPVPMNTTKEGLISLLPESVNVQIADNSYSNGKEQPQITHSPVVWDTSSLPDTVTGRIEIKGTYKTENEGFEVKTGDDIYPTLIVDPITQGQSQMPQITTASGNPVTAVNDTAKIGYGKKIKLTTSMENATIYYKLDNNDSFTEYTPDMEIEIPGVKDDIAAHTFEAYAQAGDQQSDILKLNLEVDNKTSYSVKIVDQNGSEYIYATGAGEYKLGDTVSFNMTKKYMRNPWKPGYVYEDVEDHRKTALTWSSKGILLNDEQQNNTEFNLEMPNSNVIIKIESFKYKDQVHDVTVVDQDGKTYEYALGAGEYKEGETVTIDSTQFMLKVMNDDGVATSEKTKAVDEVVSQWSAEGVELTDEQKKSSKFEFKMPYNDVTIKVESFRPLIKKVYLSSIIPVAGKALPDKLEILSATDIKGNVIDKKDIMLKTEIPDLQGGMWTIKGGEDDGKMVSPGTMAEIGKTYVTLFSVQSAVSGETVLLDDYEMFMDGKKVEPNPIFGPHMINVETEAAKDELLAVDWGGDRELFYSKDDAKASLSKEVKVRTKYGTIDTAEVTWSGTDKLYSTVAYGDFPVTATLTLPDYVDAPNGIGTKSFTIKVRKHIDSVILKTTGVTFPARKGNTLPIASQVKIDRGTGTDYNTVISGFKLLNKTGTDVSGQIAQAGEEYTIIVSIAPNTDYAVLSNDTVFTINGNAMKVIGKTENQYSDRSEVYEVSYTFTAEDIKPYDVIVNGTTLGKRYNGNVVSISTDDTAGFDHWSADAVYTTTETVTEGEGENATTKEITVEHRSPVNLFKDGAEYNAKTSFVMPLLVDDNAKLEITANYSYGITAYDRETKTANIIADKDYSNAAVIFAVYNNFDKLISVKWADVNLTKGNNTVTAPENFTVNDGEKVCIMVWNNVENMTPLFKSFEQSYEKKSEKSGDTGNTGGSESTENTENTESTENSENTENTVDSE